MKQQLLSLLTSALLIFNLICAGTAFAQTQPSQIKYLMDSTLGGRPLEARDSNGVLLASYVWAPSPTAPTLLSISIRQKDGTYKTFYPHTDSLNGSIRALTDEAGKIVGIQEFDAFGQVLISQGATSSEPFPTSFGYRAEQHDKSTGLVYMHDRWYDPSTGRFISQDTYDGNPARPITLNKYVYADSDPVNKFDPTGRFSLSEMSVADVVQGILSRNQQVIQAMGGRKLVFKAGCFVLEEVATNAVVEGIYFLDDVLSNNKGRYAGKSVKVERRIIEHVGSKIQQAEHVLFSFAVTADAKMKMKEALKIAEQWAIRLIGGAREPGVSNRLNAFDVKAKKNGALRAALAKVDWCK